MRVVSDAEIQAWHDTDPYYAGRVPYLSIAADIIRRLPGQSCLEIGPHRHCLVPASDTMDTNHRLEGITYRHDAGVGPWPITRTYDLVLALQVWEHLGGRQFMASIEAFRVGKHVLLSFPYLWPTHDEHGNISRFTIEEWTHRRDPVLTWRVASDHPGLKQRMDRILYLFEGDA